MDLTARAAALLVIDMQNGFFSPDGSIARIGFPVDLLAPAIPGCVALVAAARAAGVPVAHTQYVYAPGHSDGGTMVDLLPDLRREHALIQGSWDADFIPELQPGPGEPVFVKNRPSGFLNTGLEVWLDANAVERLIVCGVTTNCCVESTVRDASQRDVQTFVVEDAVAEYDPERHRVSLRAMGLLFARLVTVAEVQAAFGESARAAA